MSETVHYVILQMYVFSQSPTECVYRCDALDVASLIKSHCLLLGFHGRQLAIM